MGHVFWMHLYHVCFRTVGGRAWMTDARQRDRLGHYLSAVVEKEGGNCVEAAVMPDHVHLLLTVRPEVTLSHVVGKLQHGSARWMRRSFTEAEGFDWQQGYASFTVSVSRREQVVAYLRGQTEHHRGESYPEELARLLKAHGVDFDLETYLD